MRVAVNIVCTSLVLDYFQHVDTSLASYQEFADSCRLDMRIRPQHVQPGPEGIKQAKTQADALYGIENSGYRAISESEKQAIHDASKGNGDSGDDVGCESSTYGEILPPFGHLDFEMSPDGSRFMDLGAGVGKMLILAAVFYNASEAVGVELSKTRWETGCRAFRRIAEHFHAETDTSDVRSVSIELQLGDIATANISNATHVYTYSTCLPRSFLERLQSKLLLELPFGARVFSTAAMSMSRDGKRAFSRAWKDSKNKYPLPGLLHVEDASMVDVTGYAKAEAHRRRRVSDYSVVAVGKPLVGANKEL